MIWKGTTASRKNVNRLEKPRAGRKKVKRTIFNDKLQTMIVREYFSWGQCKIFYLVPKICSRRKIETVNSWRFFISTKWLSEAPLWYLDCRQDQRTFWQVNWLNHAFHTWPCILAKHQASKGEVNRNNAIKPDCSHFWLIFAKVKIFDIEIPTRRRNQRVGGTGGNIQFPFFSCPLLLNCLIRGPGPGRRGQIRPKSQISTLVSLSVNLSVC